MSFLALQPDELDRMNELLDEHDVIGVLIWAALRFGDRLTMLTSLQDAVLVDLACRAGVSIDITFLDTGYHFPETLEMVRVVQERYGVDVTVIPPAAPVLDSPPPGFCCADDKVGQLERALHGREAWISGIRRSEGGLRGDAPLYEVDRRGVAKINPLVVWNDADVEAYIIGNDVPVNPLRDQGYPSIGCWPCTSPADGTESTRSGRWAGTTRTECGLHW